MSFFEWPCDLFFSSCTTMVVIGVSATIVVVVGSTCFVKSMIMDMKK